MDEDTHIESHTESREPRIHFEVSFTSETIFYILSISFFWTWFFLAIFTNSLSFPYGNATLLESVYRVIVFVSLAVTFLVFVLARRPATHFTKQKIARIACLVASPWLALTALMADLGFEPPQIIIMITWVLFGIACACLFIMTMLTLVDLSRRTSFFFLGSAVTFGALLYLIMSAFASTFVIVFIMILPYVSFFFLFCGSRTHKNQTDKSIYEDNSVSSEEDSRATSLSQSKIAEDDADKIGKNHTNDQEKNGVLYSIREYLGQSIKVQPTQLVFGIVLGLMIGLAISGSFDKTHAYPVAFVVALCCAGPVIMAISCFFRALNIRTISWVVLIAIAICMLPLIAHIPYAGSHTIVLMCYVLFAFWFSFYDLTHTLSLVELAHEQSDLNSVKILAAGKTLFFLSLAVGWLLHIPLTAVMEDNYAILSSILAVALIVILVMVGWIGRPVTHSASDETQISFSDDVVTRDEIANQMAKEFGLSDRQSEIFLYLVQGRNAPYIAEKLFLSYHTVKSHIYRVYQQLDVHTHQELIDMVEKRLNDSKH